MPVATASSGNELYVLAAMLSVVAFVFVKNRRAILLACIFAAFLVPTLKDAFDEGRPCGGLLTCPEDKGMPSGHATWVFIFAAGSLGSPVFWFFYAVALLVSLSRVVWGVHTMAQVAAGAGLGTALYFSSKAIFKSLGALRRERIHWRAKRFLHKKAMKR
jgi:membrane-associated phospholipid phosphatase